MAKYRQLIVEGDTGWHLMSPTNAWEALRLAWLLWRHPDRVAALVGVKQEYSLEHWKPHPECDEACSHVCSEGNSKPPQCAAPARCLVPKPAPWPDPPNARVQTLP